MWQKTGQTNGELGSTKEINSDHPCLDGRKPCRAAPVKHLQTNRWQCRGHESQDQFYSSQWSRLRLIPNTHLSQREEASHYWKGWQRSPVWKSHGNQGGTNKKCGAPMRRCLCVGVWFKPLMHILEENKHFQLGCLECLQFSPQNLQKSAFATLWSIWFELQTICQNPSMDDSKMNKAPRPSAVRN